MKTQNRLEKADLVLLQEWGLHGSGHGWFRSTCSRSVEDVNKRGKGDVGLEGGEKPASTA